MSNCTTDVEPLTHTQLENTYGSFTTISPEKSSFRWCVYFACSFVMFSTWYSYFIPSGLQTQFIEDYNLSNDEYALLFSVATGPTFIVPLFAGIMIDKTGIGSPLIISCVLSTIGQIIFFIALILNNKMVMFISRCVLGIGGCCWGISMNTILAKYFVHNELAFALSVSPTMTRAGFAAADFLSYSIYSMTGKNTVIWAVLCNIIFLVLSLIGIIITVEYHRKKQKLRAVSLMMEFETKHLIKKTFSDSFIQVGKDMCTFPTSLWIIVFLTGLGFVPFSCWAVIGSNILQSVYGYDQRVGDSLLLLPCFMTIISAPFVGIFLDRFGKLINMMIISSVFYMVFHLYILLGMDNEVMVIVVLLILGMALSMFATSVWSAVVLIVDSSVIGTANAFCYMSYALLNAVSQYIAGQLTLEETNNMNKYYYVQMFFLFISFIMFIFCVILVVYDGETTKKLYRFKRKPGW